MWGAPKRRRRTRELTLRIYQSTRAYGLDCGRATRPVTWPTVSSGRTLVRVASLLAALLLVTLAGVGDQGVAYAQPSPDATESAAELEALGAKKLAEGSAEAALAAFTKADAMASSPTTSLGRARALAALGRLIEAQEAAQKAGSLPATDGEPARFATARSDAKTLAGELAERTPTVVVRVTDAPAGAAVTVAIDGLVLPPQTVGLPRVVDPGAHVVEISVDGAVKQRASFTVAERERKEVSLSVADAPPPQPAALPPPPPPPLPPPGPEDTGREGSSPLVYIGFSVAVAGVLVGSITGGLSLSLAADAEALCSADRCPEEARPDAESALALAHASTASFTLAGVGAVLGVVGLIVGGDDKRGAAAPLRVNVGLGAFALTGSF